MTTKKSTGSAGTKKAKVKKQTIKDLNPKGKTDPKGGGLKGTIYGPCAPLTGPLRCR
jgi:hypothetical protein